MFLSSSFIVVKVDSSIQLTTSLKNIHFKEQKKEIKDYSFYSINFYNKELSMGEIHWSESFNYGKMNLMNFIRKDNYFILFTSSVQNYKVLQDILSKLLGAPLNLEITKIPLNYNFGEIKLNEIINLEEQNIFGVSFMLLIQEKYNLLKIYNNGLVTYSMTNDYNITKKIINLVLRILEIIKDSDDF